MKNPTVVKAFGLHLRKLRDERALSQSALAEEADIAKNTVQRIETAKLTFFIIFVHEWVFRSVHIYVN